MGWGGKCPPPQAAGSSVVGSAWDILVGTGSSRRGLEGALSAPDGRDPVGRVKVLPQRTQTCVGMRNVTWLLFET